MRFVFSLLLLSSLAIGSFVLWNNCPQIRTFVENKISSSEFKTLEIRYTADCIMEAHKKEFLKNESYSFLEPKLVFYPYLLMEVKFAKDNQTTQEGLLLFGLHDGEMVLDADTWSKTHGYKDCLLAGATIEDFKILRLLIEAGGSLEKDKLSQKFKGETIDKWIQSCKAKQLIVFNGTKIRIHLDRPLLSTTPITHLNEKAVNFPAKSEQKIASKYSASQIQKMAAVAFGDDFAIRKSEEVHLPVYHVSIQNPDGSTRLTAWNALTGQQMY